MQIGYNTGTCPKCGIIFIRRRPIDEAICDCYLYCPKGHLMESYTPDLNPQTYGPIDNVNVSGDTEHPIKILFWCPTCQYYSEQQPIEVTLR